MIRDEYVIIICYLLISKELSRETYRHFQDSELKVYFCYIKTNQDMLDINSFYKDMILNMKFENCSFSYIS